MQHKGRVRDSSIDDRNLSFVPRTQPSPREVGLASGTVVQNHERHPHVFLKGDLRFSVTEQEVAHGPITGHYTIVTQDMQPQHVLWYAQNGRVLSRCAQSTQIDFDLSRARAEQIYTSVITVQVTDVETFDTIIMGTFVQILVTKDSMLSPSAWPSTLACA